MLKTVQSVGKMKDKLEAISDPGSHAGYKVQVVSHDHGTEFEGAMLDGMANGSSQNAKGMEKRHLPLVDNRHSTSRFWIKKGGRKRRKEYVFLLSSIGVLAQVHKG